MGSKKNIVVNISKVVCTGFIAAYKQTVGLIQARWSTTFHGYE